MASYYSIDSYSIYTFWRKKHQCNISINQPNILFHPFSINFVLLRLLQLRSQLHGGQGIHARFHQGRVSIHFVTTAHHVLHHGNDVVPYDVKKKQVSHHGIRSRGKMLRKTWNNIWTIMLDHLCFSKTFLEMVQSTRGFWAWDLITPGSGAT